MTDFIADNTATPTPADMAINPSGEALPPENNNLKAEANIAGNNESNSLPTIEAQLETNRQRVATILEKAAIAGRAAMAERVQRAKMLIGRSPAKWRLERLMYEYSIDKEYDLLVFKGENHDEFTALCSYLQIVARTHDANGKNWGCVVKFRDFNGKEIEVALPGRTINNGSALRKELSDYHGLWISSQPGAMSKLIFYLQTYEPGRRVLTEEVDMNQSQDSEVIIRRVKAFLAENSDRFVLWDKKTKDSNKSPLPWIRNQAGFKRKISSTVIKYYVFPEAFGAEVLKGLHRDTACKVLVSHKMLARSSDGKFSKKCRIPGSSKPKGFYCITIDDLADDNIGEALPVDEPSNPLVNDNNAAAPNPSEPSGDKPTAL